MLQESIEIKIKSDLQNLEKAPLWLALVLTQREICSCGLPNIYKDLRSYVLNDPLSLNLKQKSNYFYGTGAQLSSILNIKDIQQSLLQLYLQRFKVITDESMTSNCSAQSTFQLESKLEDFEVKLFRASKKKIDQLANWKERNIKAYNTLCMRSRSKKMKV